MESRNNLKIQICQEFEILEDRHCQDVLTMMENDFGFENINTCQCLIKILFNHSNNHLSSYDVLVKVHNYIKKLPKQIRNNHITSVSPQSQSQSQCNPILFPLMDLPFDLIQSILYYLNENDIKSIDPCCKILYKMINNRNFLSSYNQFKRLMIDEHILSNLANDYRTWRKIDLFKYCQCQVLELDVAAFLNTSGKDEYHKKWDEAIDNFGMIVKHCHEFKTIVKSMYELRLQQVDNFMLLTQFPTDLWLNNCNYNLKVVCIDNYELDMEYWYRETEHVKFYDNFMKSNKCNARPLKFVRIHGVLYDIWYHLHNWFNVSHLVLDDIGTDIKYFIDARKCSPSLKTLSLQSKFELWDEEGAVDDDVDQHLQLQIETLQLLKISNIGCSYIKDILDNEDNITRINLNNSVKNVTLHIQSEINGDNPGFEDCIKVPLGRLLTKYYFSKLTNINILFEYCGVETIDNVFDQVLLDKEKLSSYSPSLKQVNFGFKRLLQNACQENRFMIHPIGYVFPLCKNGVLEKNINQLKYYKRMCHKMYDKNISHENMNIFRNGNKSFDRLATDEWFL